MPTFRRSTVAGVVVLALTLAACANPAKTATSASGTIRASTTAGGSTTLAPPASPVTPTTASGQPGTTHDTTTSVATGGTFVQLNASSKGSYDVKVGQTIELSLSVPGMRWSGLSVVPAGLLAADPAPSPPADGVLAIWTATAPGTVTITAAGEAVCSPGMACPMYVRLFRVSLAIS